MCGTLVTIEGNSVVAVAGDRECPGSEGYLCIKGRSMPALYGSERRLLKPLRRGSTGIESVSSAYAMDEIAERLTSIIEKHGPRSVAIYTGTHGYLGSEVTGPVMASFADSIGTPMQFSPLTIDMPGKNIAYGLHGSWMAPPHGFPKADVGLIVGSNPIVSLLASPSGHPGNWFKRTRASGARLIVIDPRRSETARRAHLHIQPRPGQDVAIVAAMIRVILEENRHDAEFLAENAGGVSELTDAVAAFTPREAALRAGVESHEIVEAARLFADARYAFGIVGTGSNMSQSGTLIEYLVLCLQTLCGHHPRAGEGVGNPGTLKAASTPKAQVAPPVQAYGIGEPLRVSGLQASLAGAPTAALPDEILTEGVGRVRALISVGGNPAVAWPDQAKALRALRSLDLLVQIDPFMSETAKLAHYVIAPKVMAERPSTSQFAADHAGGGFGRSLAYGQYAPKLIDPPEGSDVIEEWEFFYGLARRMGYSIALAPMLTYLTPLPGAQPIEITSGPKPSTDDLLEIITGGSRIPLSEVKRHPHGKLYLDEGLRVAMKDEGWSGRFELGCAELMEDLGRLGQAPEPIDEAGFRLISRRMAHVYNSSFNARETNRGRAYNPLFIHPQDLDDLGLVTGDLVEMRSDAGAVVGVTQADDSMRPGCVSMSHAFGSSDPRDDLRQVGSCTARLLGFEAGFDRYSGQPRMSGIGVSLVAVPDGGAGL
jgi:anaerobic selenocysteine-containing dehydrogenase